MKELEDKSWFPESFRNYQTDFIGFACVKLNIYKKFSDYLSKLAFPGQTMTDLCSGSGEPAVSIFRRSGQFERLYLSDKFPNKNFPSGDPYMIYDQTPQDVLKMDFRAGTCYTMFNAFHHFSKQEKLELAEKLQASGSHTFLVEILEPRLICLIKVLLMSTLGCIVLTPFIRPFSFRRLIFTYIIPVNILTITFDGVVSVFKSKSIRYYRQLFSGPHFNVKVIRLHSFLNPLIMIEIFKNS
jgi:hypothetical protein